MKKTLLILLFFVFAGCAPSSVNVRTSFEQAQAAYEKLLTLHPESSDTQGYRIYMAKAKSAYDSNDMDAALTYSRQALDQANSAYTARIQAGTDLKNLIEQTRAKMNNLVVPSHRAVRLFFEAVRAYKNGKYTESMSAINDASSKLDLDAQTAFVHTVTLHVPENLTARFHSSIPVFAFMGTDIRLHKQIATIKGPMVVNFVNQFFVSEDFSYFHIRSDKLNIDGWVYPQFVVIGQIRTIKGGK